MKITKEHYKIIKDAMQEKAFLLPAIKSHIKCESKQPKDLAMRIRWDLFYASGISQFVCKNVYSYANDDHIDTILKMIMKEIDSK